MKKSFLFLAVCAAAMTACTSEDVIEEGVQGNAIGFESVVGKASRATDLTKANLTKFYVYSYYTQEGKTANPVQVFDGEEVTLSGSTWGYANTRYWVPGSTYYFYAYSCGNNEITSYGEPGMNLATSGNVNSRALKISNFVCNNSHQHDLIYASNEGYVGKDNSGDAAAPANKKVGFTFKHALTKVNAIFSSEFAPGYDIRISNVRLVNMYDEGDYDPKANEGEEWANVSRKTTTPQPFVNLNVTTTDNKNIASAAEDEADVQKVTTATAFVIPHEYTESYVTLAFTIEVLQNNEVFLSRNMTGTWQPNWKTGYSYTYQVAISGNTTDLEPIVFETKENMDVEDWNPDNTAAEKVEFTFSAN